MNRSLAIEFSRITEVAALAAFAWLGRGDKNAADNAAVQAMRYMLNRINMDGEIVIGEGEIDEAPMLYIGEKVGSGMGELVSIAVDPIDGTRLTALGQDNAISVLAAGGKNTFLRAPDMYMEKLIVGPEAKGMIDLNLPLEQNLRRVASRMGKLLSQLTVMVLAKPRHEAIINQMHQLGVRVICVPDGDVAGSVLCCLPEAEIDMVYGIGGAPEGVIAAAAIRALGGDMQSRLLPRNVVKGETPEQALKRELEEEIGIMVLQAELFERFEFEYPTKVISFYFYLVNEWVGEPFGREGQAGFWLPQNELDAGQFPPANAKLIQRLLAESEH